MMFFFAIAVPLFLVFSPVCGKMGGFSKFVVFVVTAVITLIIGGAIDYASTSPEERERVRNEQIAREIKAKQDRWDAEARERAEKKFYDATREYRP
jgi:hypothetical protein